MAMVGDFVAIKAFKALCAGVEELIGKNLIFKSLFIETKSRLDSLAPLIQEMVQYNQQLGCPEKELEAFDVLMKSGIELVAKCSKLRRWNFHKKYKYASQFVELNESLKDQFDMLKMQGIRDGKKTAVDVKNLQVVVQDIQGVVNSLDCGNRNQSAEMDTWFAVTDLPKFTVGLDVPLKELKRKLLEDNGVSMLVLTAPGGCGKTTLATKFCQDDHVKEIFENNIIFITVSKNPNLDLIVRQLYRPNSSMAPPFRNMENAIQSWASWRRLLSQDQKPLLLVFDDVWSGSESLLDNFDQLKRSNYKILVTSRSEFPRFGSPYRLPLLDDDNAMKLFHHSASLGDKSSHIPEDLASKIVARCKGFPLAITVVGRSLCGQRIEIWKKRVIKWSKGSSILDSETELFLCLQSSLNVLDKEMMECFLDLGLFPEDRKVPVAALIDMWAELYDLDEDTLCMANLYELSNRSLISIVDTRRIKMKEDTFYGHHFVTQHDLLRELAVYHSKRDPVEDRRRLIIDTFGNNLPKWWREQKYQTIKSRLLSISTDQNFSANWPCIQLPEVEVLVLTLRKNGKSDLPEFVEKMNKLKVLIVTCDYFLRAQLSNFQLLGSLSNVKRIRLEGILISSIINNPVQLKSLQKISLCKCDIGEAFGNGSVNMLGAFPNIQEMNLDYCNGFEELPAELCDLIHLKKISITNCHGLTRLPRGIGNLVNLEELKLRACYRLLMLPGSIRNLKKLEFLDICDCSKIGALPEYIGGMKRLRKFDMRYCLELKRLPQSVLDLDQLEEVLCDAVTKKLWAPFLQSLTNMRIVADDNYFPPVFKLTRYLSKQTTIRRYRTHLG